MAFIIWWFPSIEYPSSFYFVFVFLLISVCKFPLIGLKNVLPSKQSMKEQHLDWDTYLSRRNLDHVNGHGERVDHNTHTTQKPYKRNEQKTRETRRKRSHTQLGNGDGG